MKVSARPVVRSLPPGSVVFLACAWCAPLFAQTPATPADAARDWAAVIAVTKVAAPTAAGTRKTPAQIDTDRAQKAVQLRQAATAAKDYYTKYSADKNAAEARKLEPLLGLQGVLDNDPTHELAAMQTAKAYRDNLANPASARFEVALLSERVKARGKLGGMFGNNAAELEKIADKLRTEFGGIPAVNNFQASVARGADMATARRIATALAQAPAASPAKAEAQAILARDALLGRSLDWKLTQANGQPLDLAAQTGRKSLLYAWSPPAGESTVPPLAKSSAAWGNAQVIYVALGIPAARAQALKAAAPAGTVLCFSEAGASGTTVERFQIRSSPYVFLLNPTGTLAGFGPASQLSALIANLNR